MFRAMKTPARAQLGNRLSTAAPRRNALSSFMETVHQSAHGLTLIGAAMGVAGYVASEVTSLKQELKNNREVFEKELKVAEAKALRDVESTMEQFLRYGYAEVFNKYQEMVGTQKPCK